MDKDLINNQDDEKIKKGSKKKDSSSSKNDEVQEVDKIDKDIVEEENLIFKDKDDSQDVVVDSDMKVNEEKTTHGKETRNMESDKVNMENNTRYKEINKKNSNNTSIVLIVSILLSFVCGMLGAYLITKTVSVPQVIKNITTSELVENSISSSVDKVYGSTVVVIASSKGKTISTGTGFIYKTKDNKAYVMTNNHVIDGADSVVVEFNDKSEKIEASIVGGDKYADIAVLTIKNDNYTAVELGEVDELKLGDTIFTVGSPMGVDYKGTVTKGILSGKERMVAVNLTGNASDYYMKVLQIDAAVNPGNSGGPLCDVSGKVIGIISLKIVKDEVEGMGFAIPIEDALTYAESLEKGETIKRPFIGISMMDINQTTYLWQYGISVPKNITEGVVVIATQVGSPAASKLDKGDIITGIDDEKISTVAELRYELYKHNPGDTIKIKYLRNNKENTVEITLTENKES